MPEVPFAGGGRLLTEQERAAREANRPSLGLQRALGPHLMQGLRNAGNLLNFLGPQADIQEMVLSSQAAMDNLRRRELGLGGLNLAYTAAAPLGLFFPGTVGYHGSRHRFGPDIPENPHFKESAIDTGQGAQTFGHGIYVAEAPGVARTYRTAGSVTDAEPRGILYEVEIPDERIPQMLNWDKPLSEQSSEVIEALNKMSGREISFVDIGRAVPYLKVLARQRAHRNMTGERFYRELTQAVGNKEDASMALRQSGIRGIKYLDRKSRALSQAKHATVYETGNNIWDVDVGAYGEVTEIFNDLTQAEVTSLLGKRQGQRIFEEIEDLRQAEGSFEFYTPYNFEIDGSEIESLTRNMVIFDPKDIAMKARAWVGPGVIHETKFAK